MLDTVLQKFNIKLEDLTSAERETYFQMLESLNNKTLNTESIRDYIKNMKDAVENELVGFNEPKSFWDFLFRGRKQLYLTARLKNYMLLATFLESPEKARKALEKSLSNIKPKH